MNILKKVREEYEEIRSEFDMKRDIEYWDYTKYHPKLTLTDKDIFYTQSGSGRTIHGFIPYWYNIWTGTIRQSYLIHKIYRMKSVEYNDILVLFPFEG